MTCRLCGATTRSVIDLGDMPLANKLRPTPETPERRYPLALHYCDTCGNLQLDHCVEEAELYDEYLYITPKSSSLEAHYANLVYHMRGRGYLSPDAFMFEFGSNVGRFLAHAKAHVGRVLGLDPAGAIAGLANKGGVPTLHGFFSPESAAAVAREHGRADLVVARHCAAHNSDAHALIAGVAALIAPRGVFVMENAYGLNTVLNHEIGQIYHEHMFYFTARSVQRLFAAHGLDLIDLLFAEDIHGGSMVFYAAPAGTRPIRRVVEATIARERAILTDALLDLMPQSLERWRVETRELLDQFQGDGRSIWLYGASAKAATFVNAVGIDAPDVLYCADSTEEKIGKVMPGTKIIIRSEADAIAARPDYFLVTAWNYRHELIAKVRGAGNTHSGFAVPFPEVNVILPSAADNA